MKDLTCNKPAWFSEKEKEYVDYCQIRVARDSTVNVFSKTLHRALVIDTYYNIVYVVDFDMNRQWKLYVSDACFEIDSSLSMDDFKKGKIDVSFIRFKMSYSNREPDKRFPYMILDGRLNNAPDIIHDDIVRTERPSYAHLVGDMLYFERNGQRYLVNGDYKVIAKFPYSLYLDNTTYITPNTKEFVLQLPNDSSKWLYDIEKKEVTFVGISKVAWSGCAGANDFIASNGDIYVYNKTSGRFVLGSECEHFVDTFKEVTLPNDTQNKERLSCTDYVHVYLDNSHKEPRYYIMRNNKVLNEKCPFDSIECIGNDNYKCMANGMTDYYKPGEGFLIKTFNLDGNKDEMWFEKEA